jgi:hypothetical protein
MVRQRAQEGRRVSRGWPILVAIILLISSSGCSLAARMVGPRVRAAGPQEGVAAALLQVATRTPWPTFTPTVYHSPTPWFTPLATPTPPDTATPTGTATPTNTPIPTATAAVTPAALFVPTATPVPTNTRAPLPPTATPTPTPTPTPSFAYRMLEVYEDYTSNLFLTGYIAIVNAQEIPIGGVKAVGVFEPSGQRHESPLSQWFFDARTAPSVVMKTASVKFEPPGGIQRGTWFIHLEDEWGTRLSEDVPINTDPASPKWFYIKFKQPSLVAAKTPAPAAASNSGSYSTSPTAIKPTAGPTPPWYPTPTPTATRPASTAGWAFSSVQSVTNQDGLTVYGDLLNQTGSSQQLAQVVGTFYDGQGQVIAGPDEGYDFWPTQVVPPGGRMPFDLAVYDIQSAADFDLEVISQPTGETPRQDFEFLGVATSSANGSYCVTGKLRNPGGELSHYLVISAALYNSEDEVINFDILDVPTPGLVVGDEALSFSICVDTHNQQAARYELQAWGQ